MSWPLFRLIVNKDSISHFLAVDNLRGRETINSFSFAWVTGCRGRLRQNIGRKRIFIQREATILGINYRNYRGEKIIVTNRLLEFQRPVTFLIVPGCDFEQVRIISWN